MKKKKKTQQKIPRCSHRLMLLYYWEQEKKKDKKKYLLLSTVGASYLLCLSPNTKCAGFFSHFHWKTEKELSSANFHPS